MLANFDVGHCSSEIPSCVRQDTLYQLDLRCPSQAGAWRYMFDSNIKQQIGYALLQVLRDRL